MNVHVTVDLDGDILVAVKTATGAEAVDRLRHESARLADARHPGVVALVSCRDLEPAIAPAEEPWPPSCELRTAYAGEPLTRWTGSVADVGGVAAVGGLDARRPARPRHRARPARRLARPAG